MDSAQNFIQTQINRGDAFQADWSETSKLYSKKLWHHLGIHLEKFVGRSDVYAETNLRKLYEDLIFGFANKLNPLMLSRIVIRVSTQILEKENPESSIQFLRGHITNSGNTGVSKSLILTRIASIYLNNCNDLINARLMKEESEKLLDDIDGITPAHPPYYHLSSSYYSVTKNYGKFYREALKYLGCLGKEELKSIPKEELEGWTAKLCVSALLSRDIYNFGELLVHDVTEYISESNKYLLDLVRCFNEGSLEKIENMTQLIMSQPDLAKDIEFLKEKITLMALVETIFQRPVNQRTIDLKDVGAATKTDITSVELMIMKAMSKGLIKGLIDEVNEMLSVTWVQPRVLQNDQIRIAQDNMMTWAMKVTEMRELVETNASEIIG